MDNGTDRLKLAIISGAAHALNYKRESPKTTDEDIIQKVSKEIESIIRKIDEEA